MESKIYCINCKRFSISTYGCRMPSKKVFDESVGQWYHMLTALENISKNKYNDCKDFKPTLFYKIITYIKSKL